MQSRIGLALTRTERGVGTMSMGQQLDDAARAGYQWIEVPLACVTSDVLNALMAATRRLSLQYAFIVDEHVPLESAHLRQLGELGGSALVYEGVSPPDWIGALTAHCKGVPLLRALSLRDAIISESAADYVRIPSPFSADELAHAAYALSRQHFGGYVVCTAHDDRAEASLASAKLLLRRIEKLYWIRYM